MANKWLWYAALLGVVPVAASADIVVPMHLVNPQGLSRPIGQIVISQSKYGLVFTPALTELPPGLHGFHLHQNPDCGPQEKDGKPVAALAAGGHYDPQKTNRHGPPWGDGHLGDLPPLYVDAAGRASLPVLAPRLKLSDVKGRTLILHQGGDNYSDYPEPLGGGGVRIACGVIP